MIIEVVDISFGYPLHAHGVIISHDDIQCCNVCGQVNEGPTCNVLERSCGMLAGPGSVGCCTIVSTDNLPLYGMTTSRREILQAAAGRVVELH